MVKLKNTKIDVNFPQTHKNTRRLTHHDTLPFSPHLNMLYKVAGTRQSWWSSAEGKCSSGLIPQTKKKNKEVNLTAKVFHFAHLYKPNKQNAE